MSQEKKNSVLETNSLSRKIISKLLVTVAVMLFLIVVVSAVISMISKIRSATDKLVSVAYENAFLIDDDIQMAYGQGKGLL